MEQEILGLVDASLATKAAAGGSSAALFLLLKREFTEFIAKRAAKEDRETLIKSVKDEINVGAKDIDKIKQLAFEIRKLTVELHKWHDKEDADGIKLWYKASTTRAVETLASVIKEQTHILDILIGHIDGQSTTLKQLINQTRKES